MISDEFKKNAITFLEDSIKASQKNIDNYTQQIQASQRYILSMQQVQKQLDAEKANLQYLTCCRADIMV